MREALPMKNVLLRENSENASYCPRVTFVQTFLLSVSKN